jgi:hypothetical protein
LFLTPFTVVVLATGSLSAGTATTTGVVVFVTSFFILDVSDVAGLATTLTGMVSESLSKEAVLLLVSLPIMMSVVTQPCWSVSALSVLRNRRGALACSIESLGIAFLGVNNLLVYSLPAAQLAANATMSIKMTACTILNICMAIEFILVNKSNELTIQFICHKILKSYNMKYFLIVLTVMLCGMSTQAQTAEDSVKATINTMFTAMKNADTVMLKGIFSDNAVFQTIVGAKDGTFKVRNEEVGNFITSIGKLTAGDADERIKFETVKIDGPLAIAWTPYQFYYKEKFSHCGVNSFQLVKINGQWKIQYIIDTRRKNGCGE